ncbi:MAG: hypothetical protein IKP76_00735 [Bacilli bacterium]|nr:hypothetical protein [Bacilli bacterium]
MNKYDNKTNIPDKYMWNLTDIYSDLDALNDVLKSIDKKIDELSLYVDSLNNHDTLYNFLEEYNQVIFELDRINNYLFLLNAEDMTRNDCSDKLNYYKKISEKVSNIYTRLISYISVLNKEEYNNLINDTRLSKYKNMLDDIINNQKRTINIDYSFFNKRQELYNSINDFGTVEVDGESITINKGNISSLLDNKDRNVREDAYNKYRSQFTKHIDEFASYLNGHVKSNNDESIKNGFNNYIDYVLFNRNIPSKILDILSSITDRSNQFHYYEYLKDTLKIDKLRLYDVDQPLMSYDKNYSVEDAQQMCLDTVSIFGKEYYDLFKGIFDNKDINYYYYNNRNNGNFCCPINGGHSKIMLTFNDDISSVYKMIHECGHSVNHQLVNLNNDIMHRRIDTIIAEIASITNEMLLSNYLINNSIDNKEKQFGIARLLNIYNNYFYGYTSHLNIMRDMYIYSKDGNELSSQYLNELCDKYQKKQYGDCFEPDEYSSQLWILKQLYYRDFYPLAYILGVVVSANIINLINNGDKDIINNYIKYLSLGSDISITDRIKVLGIDICDEKVYINAINYYDELLMKYIELTKEKVK